MSFNIEIVNNGIKFLNEYEEIFYNASGEQSLQISKKYYKENCKNVLKIGILDNKSMINDYNSIHEKINRAIKKVIRRL